MLLLWDFLRFSMIFIGNAFRVYAQFAQFGGQSVRTVFAGIQLVMGLFKTRFRFALELCSSSEKLKNGFPSGL
jgi:hypothetical protein